jgi:LuxR family maltose regulon positive regulatory protein
VSATVLQTKLIIPLLHPNLVPRSRLTNQIEMGVQFGHKLTLVAAPAGFGKTTVVSAWVHQNRRKVAWFSLDEGDNEVTVFWAYVVASIRTVLPDFAETIFTALTASPPAPLDSILPTLVNELAGLEAPLALVLDDYHAIANQEIHDSISFLLDHQPQQLHLVIATRADPPLPVARIRAQRCLTELRADDLRFTEEEARALLNGMMGLGLAEEDVNVLERRTEGWGVGLLLAAQSMRGRSDKHAFISAFSGSQHYILEYLIEEVLNRQTAKARRFLLQTSILDRLCGSLCDALVGANNSEATIQELSKENLFIIPLDQDHIWYRYHHLLADLLVNFLGKEFAREEILELHRRASQWYQKTGEYDKAVKYALSGQDFEGAADLVEQTVDQVIARGQVKTLLGWIGAIPKEVIKSRPRLLMHQGWVVFLSGRVTLASQILQEAKHALTSISEEEDKNLLHGRLSAMLATITVLTRDINGALVEAQEALANLPEGEFIYRARATRVLGVSHMFLGEMEQALEYLERAKSLALEGQNKFLASEISSQMGTIRRHQGKLSLAFGAYQQILNFYEHPEAAPPACLGYVGLAEIALERNDLKDAETYLNKGIDLCLKGHIGYALQPAYLIGGLLKYALGDKVGARETIQKGEDLSRTGGGSLESRLGLAWFQTRLYLLFGELERARNWATGKLLSSNCSFEGMPPVLDEMHQSLLARVYLKNSEFEKVLDIYEHICPQAEKSGRLARVIELNLFKAVALNKMGKPKDALAALETCLALTEPEGYLRLFLELGEDVADLLQGVRTEGELGEYVSKLLAAFNGQQVGIKSDAETIPSQFVLIESLTERELEVLRLMCEGCSNQQIADTMIVSVNTVKKHTSNIYGKLGVRNRAQAVLHAREIKLI